MYWDLLKLVILVLTPLPVGASIAWPDRSKNEWIFSCREWKTPYNLAREVYLEHCPPIKTE
jgi:hypothetical protein